MTKDTQIKLLEHNICERKIESDRLQLTGYSKHYIMVFDKNTDIYTGT